MPIPANASATSGVTSDDVAITLGRPITSDDEVAQVSQWIADAEMQVRLRLGDLSLLDPEALAYVVREAVAARVRNPSGFQYEAIDDYRYGLPAESRRITILDEWWDLLTPDNGAGSAFSISPYGAPGYSVEPDAWVTPTDQA